MTKLSVITVCFNEKNIERTCENIINQSNQNFEWIVIDGGSTDGTLDILNRYKNRINIFVSEPDSGIYNAMNKGIKLASGEYLNFMNGGDEFASCNVVDDFLKLGQEYNEIDVIYGNMNCIKKAKSEIRIFNDNINKMFFYYDCINHQATFIKKELFDKYGLYNEKLRVISDWEKWIIFIKNNCQFKHWNYLVSKFYSGGICSSDMTQKELKQIRPKYFSCFEIAVLDFLNKNKCSSVKLFHLIPFLKIKKKETKLVVRLFNIFSLYKIKYKDNTAKHYLLGFIPFIEKREVTR